MPINVVCECGASYRVKDELEGKLMRCKSCEATIRITEATAPAKPKPRPKPVQQRRPKARPKPTTQRSQKRRDVLPEPTFEADPDQRQLRRELQRSREASNSAASNPGMLRVNSFQFIKAYPKWPLIWIVGLLLSIGLAAVNLGFLVLVAIFAFAVWMYFSRLKSQFVAGCVNPGMIVSVDPPLVAVHTDLTKGGEEFLVVKIEAHPIHKMSTGAPSEGQRLTTVAFYESAEDELQHWTDFTPRLSACATTDQRALQKQLASIDDEDWEALDAALDQIEDPLEPGLYRYYPPAALERRFDLVDEDIADIIDNVMSGVRNCELLSEGGRIPRDAGTYLSKDVRNEILAVVTSAQVSADDRQGIALSPAGVYYNFSELGKGEFAWDEVAGAFLVRDGLEVTFTDGERLLFPKSHFLSQTRNRLEILIDTIGRGEVV